MLPSVTVVMTHTKCVAENRFTHEFPCAAFYITDLVQCDLIGGLVTLRAENAELKRTLEMMTGYVDK